MKKKILMVAPECAPFSKVGGLADMVSSLSKSLADEGCEVKVFTPLYSAVARDASFKRILAPLSVHMGMGIEEFSSVWEAPLGKAKVYFLEFNRYYDRPGIYDFGSKPYDDNAGRYAFMSRAALDFCGAINWTPDVIHCHDWTAGFVPMYMNTTMRHLPIARAASVFTIHNLQHQGVFGEGILDYAGFNKREVFHADNCEALGAVNMMKGGIYNATKITTVSPTYSREIQTSQYGCGLDPVLRFRAADLMGIINGVDTQEWHPSSDKKIAANYDIADLSGKAKCKEALQKKMGLKVDAKVPLFGVVSRLYDQKGLDLLADISQGLLDNMQIQIALLGNGDSALEGRFSHLSNSNPGRIACHIGFDNALSHQIEAGSDFFLMPSRFEPCGLNQMYSMIYGTIPVVRSTGGLADTVDSYVEGAGKGDGFVFGDATPDALYNTIGWACSTWYDRPREISALRRNCMSKNFTWKKSAKLYLQVYRWAMGERANAFA